MQTNNKKNMTFFFRKLCNIKKSPYLCTRIPKGCGVLETLVW